jgi:polyisoprenoid-binding protein YceI
MKPLRVLVLDPSPEGREELLTLLRDAQHHVVSAPDARTAAEALATPGFDALLLDLTSPELDLAGLRRAIFPADSAEPDALEEVERRHLALMLRHTGGNKRRAANLLGISRSTLLNKVRKYGLALVAPLMFASVPGLHGQAPAPVPRAHVASGTLSFDGHATVGDFVGKTDSVSGRMTGGAQVSAVRGWVEAPVRTLMTGDRRRDKDLNKSMESSRYPNIRFELTGVTPKNGTADSLPTTLHGALVIHGVRKMVDLPAVVAFTSGEVRLRSDFPLNLKDYRIGGLSKMLGLLKMSENIEVHVDLRFGLEPRS